MSDFDRYGATPYRDRERNWRDEERDRGFFPNGGDDYRSSRSDQRRGFFSDDRDSRFRGRDRDREPVSRDNQPGRLSGGGGLFGHDSPSRDEDGRSGRERHGEQSRFGNDDEKRSLPIDETEQLIASNKVEGTPVYGREGERLGTIYNFMVDKYSGRVTYAVMGYGGFLGVGQRYYPLPWQILSYDTREGGYRVDLDYRDMERAPSFGREDEPRFNRDYGRRVHSWYGLDY